MGSKYILCCMWHKFLSMKRALVLIFLGLLIAAWGAITVASVARNRELQTPWYAQRTAKIAFERPTSPVEAYSILNAEYTAGTVNGYALIVNVDTSGGISLGGQEGALWHPVRSDDRCFSTQDNLFWIHQQAVPEKFFHNLESLTVSIDGHELMCAGLSYYGLNWEWRNDATKGSVSFLIDGKPAKVDYPTLENVYIDEEWIYIAPVIVGAGWVANNDIPITGLSITLVNPNDQITLNRITSRLTVPFNVSTEWNVGRVGPLTANEWIYLGALILAMLNVASLYYGLIDSYGTEFYIFRKIGATKGSICIAVLLLIALLSVCAFAGGWLIYRLLLICQANRQCLAALPAGYTVGLFIAYVGLSSLLVLRYTRNLLRSFRKKGLYL